MIQTLSGEPVTKLREHKGLLAGELGGQTRYWYETGRMTPAKPTGYDLNPDDVAIELVDGHIERIDDDFAHPEIDALF